MSELEEYSILEVLRDITAAEESFYRVTRFLDGRTRNHVVAAYLRNTSMKLQILQTYMSHPQTTTLVMNIPHDISGNFMESVPVVPSRNQIALATQSHVGVTDTTCSICQEPVTCATRIRECGHSFHGSCIDQWFSMNPRCPVCRHDIREQLSGTVGDNGNENSSMHSDEESAVGVELQ